MTAACEDDDALSQAFFDARKADLANRVSPKRLKHVMGVVAEAELLAKAYGVDLPEARLAALLHDWDKGLDDAAIRARVAEVGLDVDPWILKHQPRLLHGPTAARALAKEFPQIPRSVLQAIDRHTAAAPDMSPLDMVVYVADALEPNRQFGRLDQLRALVGKVSLEELFVQVLGYWTCLLFERKKTVHPGTVDVWNHYAEKYEKPYVQPNPKETM